MVYIDIDSIHSTIENICQYFIYAIATSAVVTRKLKLYHRVSFVDSRTRNEGDGNPRFRRGKRESPLHSRFHFACLYIWHKNSLTYNAHTAEYENARLLRNVLRVAGIRSGIRQTLCGFSTRESFKLSRLIQIGGEIDRKKEERGRNRNKDGCGERNGG